MALYSLPPSFAVLNVPAPCFTRIGLPATRTPFWLLKVAPEGTTIGTSPSPVRWRPAHQVIVPVQFMTRPSPPASRLTYPWWMVLATLNCTLCRPGATELSG